MTTVAYYDALIAKWATLPAAATGAQVEANIAALNALMVAGPNADVPVSAVIGYLALNMKLQPLRRYAALTASGPAQQQAIDVANELLTLLSLPDAPPFATSNATIYDQLEAMLTTLAGDASTGIVAGDVTALLGLSTTWLRWLTGPVSAGGAGFNPEHLMLNVHDLIAAGLVSEETAKSEGIW